MESRLAELGGELRRDWRLIGVEQDDEGESRFTDPRMLRARYLVGPTADPAPCAGTTSGGHLLSGLPTTNGVNLSCGGAVAGWFTITPWSRRCADRVGEWPNRVTCAIRTLQAI